MRYFATAKEMERLDRYAVQHGLEIRQMMELAGWHMVSLFERLKIPKSSKVAVVCGRGNKGGDGLSAARHLTNNGWKVSVILLSKSIKPDPKHHLILLKNMKVEIVAYGLRASNLISKADVLVDALIGYHLEGAPRGVYKKAIEEMNKSKAKIISYDIPSGVDATWGECFMPRIQAAATLSLAMPKKAFLKKDARKLAGRIIVADIGIPAFLYDKIKKGSRPLF